MEFSVEIQNYMFGTRNMTVTGRVSYSYSADVITYCSSKQA